MDLLRHVHRDDRPAHDVERAMLDRSDLSILNCDQHRALGAGLARIAPLQIARIDDVRRLAQDRVKQCTWPSAQ